MNNDADATSTILPPMSERLIKAARWIARLDARVDEAREALAVAEAELARAVAGLRGLLDCAEVLPPEPIAADEFVAPAAAHAAPVEAAAPHDDASGEVFIRCRRRYPADPAHPDNAPLLAVVMDRVKKHAGLRPGEIASRTKISRLHVLALLGHLREHGLAVSDQAERWRVCSAEAPVALSESAALSARVLRCLMEHPGSTPGRISDLTGLHHGTVVAICTGLRKDGKVVKDVERRWWRTEDAR